MMFVILPTVCLIVSYSLMRDLIIMNHPMMVILDLLSGFSEWPGHEHSLFIRASTDCSITNILTRSYR